MYFRLSVARAIHGHGISSSHFSALAGTGEAIGCSVISPRAVVWARSARSSLARLSRQLLGDLLQTHPTKQNAPATL
jgi:hypothetical protein